MKRKNLIIILIIVLIIFFILYFIKIQFLDKIENKEGQDTIEEIENEEYYIEKQKEFIEAEDEYEEILTSYINSMFSQEELNRIKQYNERLTRSI